MSSRLVLAMKIYHGGQVHIRKVIGIGDQEIFSVEEMIEFFDIADVNQSASSFNPEKLLWLNQQHIMATPAEQLGQDLMPFLIRTGLDPADGPDPVHVAEAYHERAETLLHMASSARYCYEDFSVIDDKPPEDGERYIFNPPVPVELIDAATGLGTGIFIVREIHDEDPSHGPWH